MVNKATTNTATVSWDRTNNAYQYVVRYRLTTDVNWLTQTATDTFMVLNSLAIDKAYECQVQSICNQNRQSGFSKSVWFNTASVWNQTATGDLFLANPNAQIGIGSVPSAKLHVLGGALFEGSSGMTPISGAGTRMMWIPVKSALRAGTVSGSQWDDSNIGIGSVAMGENALASGTNGFALGKNTEAIGTNAFALGYGIRATANNSMVMGRSANGTPLTNEEANTFKFFWGTDAPVLTIKTPDYNPFQNIACQTMVLDPENNQIPPPIAIFPIVEMNHLRVRSYSRQGGNGELIECGGTGCFDHWLQARYFKALNDYYFGLDCATEPTPQTLRLKYIPAFDQTPKAIGIGTAVPAMQVYDNGRVGIGNTNAPNAMLQVGDLLNLDEFRVAIQGNRLDAGGRAIVTNGEIQIQRQDQTYATSFNVRLTDTNPGNTYQTRCYSVYSPIGGTVKHRFTQWGDGAMTWNQALPGNAMIDCQDETGKKLFYVGKDGKVGIGTNTPLDAKLTVDGTVCMKEGWVRLSGAPCWPDYVFEQGYTVPSLDSVEQYVRTHKHLPEVPSAKEVEANGFMIGETQRAMLKNMEEMYLQMIELNKRVKALEAENKALKEKVGK